MKLMIGLTILLLGACSSTSSDTSGPAACTAAGGQCLIGGNSCPNRGPQDCNPDKNPGGAFCCLPCPTGTKANDGGTACE